MRYISMWLERAASSCLARLRTGLALSTHSVALGFDQLPGASILTVAIGPFSATQRSNPRTGPSFGGRSPKRRGSYKWQLPVVTSDKKSKNDKIRVGLNSDSSDQDPMCR